MKAFAELFAELESQKNKARLPRWYAFEQAEPEDAAWALHLLNEGEITGPDISGARMREAVSVSTGLPLWLIEESYAMVGDLAETCALLLRSPGQTEQPLHHWFGAGRAHTAGRRTNHRDR